uniref:Uncharacterized protein n=1 Tax=Corethron hystrix TaxID=216773 RepID=A0A6U5MAC9_9STRA
MSGSTDTFDDLKTKIGALGKVNEDILENISSVAHEDGEIITGHHCRIRCTNDTWKNMSSRNKMDKPGSLESFGFHKESVTHTAKNIISGWKYSGEKLEALDEYFFEGSVDCSLENYDDLERLNKVMVQAANNFLEIARDCPKARLILRMFLSNLERLQVAIGDVHGLTMDVESKLPDDQELLDGLRTVCDGFEKIMKNLPRASLSLHCDQFDGLQCPRDQYIRHRTRKRSSWASSREWANYRRALHGGATGAETSEQWEDYGWRTYRRALHRDETRAEASHQWGSNRGASHGDGTGGEDVNWGSLRN